MQPVAFKVLYPDQQQGKAGNKRLNLDWAHTTSPSPHASQNAVILPLTAARKTGGGGLDKREMGRCGGESIWDNVPVAPEWVSTLP